MPGSMLKVSQVLQVCVRRQLWRSFCSSAAAGDKRPPRTQVQVQSCTVDPNLEEPFVFLDCSGEGLTYSLIYFMIKTSILM